MFSVVFYFRLLGSTEVSFQDRGECVSARSLTFAFRLFLGHYSHECLCMCLMVCRSAIPVLHPVGSTVGPFI